MRDMPDIHSASSSTQTQISPQSRKPLLRGEMPSLYLSLIISSTGKPSLLRCHLRPSLQLLPSGKIRLKVTLRQIENRIGLLCKWYRATPAAHWPLSAVFPGRCSPTITPTQRLCATLSVGQYVCCSEGTLPNRAPNPELNGYCAKHEVATGDTCSAIAASHSITVADMEKNNKDTWG